MILLIKRRAFAGKESKPSRLEPFQSSLSGRHKTSIILPWVTPDDFTLANARRIYSSSGELPQGKGVESKLPPPFISYAILVALGYVWYPAKLSS